MASTTPNRKAIVDFLWEWTENHADWSKLLISKIVTTESSLSTTDRETVFNYFLQSINLHTGLPALTVTKPTYIPTEKMIELDSLSAITGVNRLAKIRPSTLQRTSQSFTEKTEQAKQATAES